MNVPIKMRKIVPVVARTSAGKSNLLNVLYNINFLECKPDIATKFINLLRYNPDINEPIFFRLKLIKEKEKYIFYRDEDFEEISGEQNIIDENKRINRVLANEKEINYEKIFYMTELKESPFIKDEKYLLEHDLCDIPGLSEAKMDNEEKNKEGSPKNNEDSEKNTEKNNLNSFLEQILGFFLLKNNEVKKETVKTEDEKKEEDEIFYKTDDEKNTYLSEIFKIMKDYIDGAIIILSQDNYLLKFNYELIAKFKKVINKPISNFLIILNKIDLSENPEDDINNCKALFLRYFPKCKTFNLNLNTFSPLCIFRLKNELLLNKSFKHLLKYHLDNYIERSRLDSEFSLNYSFIEYLKEIIKLKREKEKEQIQKVMIKDSVEKEIKDITEQLKEIHKRNEIRFGFDSYSEEINPMEILKDLYKYHKNNYLIPYPSENTYNLLNYFKTRKPSENQIFENRKREVDEMFLKINKNLDDIDEKLKNESLITIESYKIIKDNLEKLGFDKNIYIPFLGPKNVGKSSIINGLIGEEILSKNTNKAFIISYTDDKNSDISISKTELKEKIVDNKTRYYFDFANDYKIAEGLDKVKETIIGLNREFSGNYYDQNSNNPEKSFYHIKTKIKLFDDLKINDNIKQNIYLFDFPGLENSNELEKFISKSMLNIFNLFIFIFRRSLINDPNKQIYWEYIFKNSINEKGILQRGFINSCLFILNNDDKNEIEDNYAFDEIKKILLIDKEKYVNILSFNAEYYKTYIKYHNFFFNIKDTIKNLFREYYYNANKVLKYPELNKTKNAFPSFIIFLMERLKEIINKKKELFQMTIPKDQQINKNIITLINEAINDIELPKYKIKVELKDVDKKRLSIIFSFAQNNIHNSILLKNSNYESIKSSILEKIIDINKEIYSKYEKSLQDIYKKFDGIFLDYFSINEQRFEEYRQRKETLMKEFNLFVGGGEIRIKALKKKIIDIFKFVLNNLKSEITNKESGIIKKKTIEIKDILFRIIKKELKTFHNDIEDIFNYIIHKQNEFDSDFTSLISNFVGNNVNLDTSKNFKEYFILTTLGKSNNGININYDLSEEISREIESYIYNGIYKIFNKKGFFEFLFSKFSNVNYFSNIIDIIFDYSNDKFTSFFELLLEHFTSYMRDKIEIINMRLDFLSLTYNNMLEDLKRKAKVIEDKYKIKKSENESLLQNIKKLLIV